MLVTLRVFFFLKRSGDRAVAERQVRRDIFLRDSSTGKKKQLRRFNKYLLKYSVIHSL